MTTTAWRFDDHNWRSRAACSAENRDKFFPQGAPSKEPLDLCAECPVRQTCLETALNSPWKPYGIWGGLTHKDLWPMWAKRHPRRRPHEIAQYLGLPA
jgi:WhiB family redox-sensing transcriptional regulator